MQTEKSTMKSLQNDKRVGCVIMASGISKRFGENKLLYEINGQTLIQRTLDITEGLFEKRIVVTRTKSVQELCAMQGIEVVLHDSPYRNEALRFGVEAMCDMDFCVFCPCDQPFLKKETLARFAQSHDFEADDIVRLACETHPGTPMMFGKQYYEELKKLPPKLGGSHLANHYAEKVQYLYVDKLELEDIDTPDDLKKFNLYD